MKISALLLTLGAAAIACGGKAVAPIDSCTDITRAGHEVAPPATDGGVVSYTCDIPALPIQSGRAECHFYEVLPGAAPTGCDASIGLVNPDDATLAKLRASPPGQLDPNTHPVCELQQVAPGDGWACATGAVGWCAPAVADGNPQHCRLAFAAGSEVTVGTDYLLTCGNGC